MYLLNWQKFENNMIPSISTIVSGTKDGNLTQDCPGTKLLAPYEIPYVAHKDELKKKKIIFVSWESVFSNFLEIIKLGGRVRVRDMR